MGTSMESMGPKAAPSEAASSSSKVFKNACRARTLPRRVWDATQRLREQCDQFEAVEEDLKVCLDHVDGLIMGKPGQSSHSVIFCDKGVRGWDDPEVLDGSIKYHFGTYPVNMKNFVQGVVFKRELHRVRRYMFPSFFPLKLPFL